MAYFMNVGRVEGLKWGLGSRGWQIWRRGKVVFVRWGAIEILSGYPKRVFWTGDFQPEKYRFPNENSAIQERARRIKQKTTGKIGSWHGVYQRLPRGQTIRSKKK